jgi:hypothetical protein
MVPKGVGGHFHPARCGQFSVLSHSGVRGNKIAYNLARDETVNNFGTTAGLRGFMAEYTEKEKTLDR